MASNWNNHDETDGGFNKNGGLNKRSSLPDEDREGLILEGEFEEIIQSDEPEVQREAPVEKPVERRRHTRRVNTARPLFETRAGDRRKSKRILDIYA